MNEPGAGSHRQNVQENACGTAKYPIDIAKEQLGGHFPWGDVEQIGSAEAVCKAERVIRVKNDKCVPAYSAVRSRVVPRSSVTSSLTADAGRRSFFVISSVNER